jgi:hypothetical protein
MINRFRRNHAVVVTSLLFALTLVNQGLAQITSGDLTGLITDASGGAVPGATVDLTNEATGVKATQTSDATGEYHFYNLAIGMYDLSVSAKGFAPTDAKGIPILTNRMGTQNITLQVGQTATSVEVTESAGTVDSSTAQITNNYETRVVSDLPSSASGQGVINLSLLSAGVASAGGIGIGEGPSIGGQRPRNNNFTVEGIDNNEKSTTGALIYVPNDAVQEFTVLQNLFTAEFGHSSGGQFNTIVKSGTNEYHGTIYDYLQNRNLNAIDQANQNAGFKKNPRFDSNRLGANFGGPILKNKLFFFADFEYNPTGQSSSTISGLAAPTAAGYATLAALPGISQTNLKIVQQYSPVAPQADQGVQPYTLPNGGTINIPIGTPNLVAPNFENQYYLVTSIDYNLSDKDQLRGRFLYNKTSGFPPSDEAELPAFLVAVPITNYLATFTEFHDFTPSLTNEFRFGYSRFNQQLPAGNFKFPGLDSFPNITFDELGIQLGVNSSSPQETIQNTYQFTDNLSWVKGRHTFKFGFDGRKYISPETFTQRERGDYEYSQITDFLFDLTPADLAERTTGNPVYYGDQISTYFYASDNWKVRPDLTIDLGVRYEFTSEPYSVRLQNVNALASVPGLINFTTPQPQYTNFAPRLGVAWSPGHSGNTSVRAGFGMAYDVLFDNIGITTLPPQFSQTVDVTCGADNDWQCPGGFLAKGGIPPSASAGTLTAAQARAGTSAYNPNQVLPYSVNWTLGAQHSFAKDYVLEVRYVGTRGVHLPTQIQLNMAPIVTPTNFLPTYTSNPGQAALNALPLTLNTLEAEYSATATPNISGGMLPQWYNAGFESKITSYQPWGWSLYNALDVQLDRRLTRGLLMRGAYTWSHNIDNSTAEFNTTVFTPRRAENSQNLTPEKATSALDRRQRLTLTMLYDLPYYSHSPNYFMKNVVGNWEVAPVYTFQSPEYYTVQSGTAGLLNGDGANVDRAIDNPSGVPNTSTAVTALKNSAGQTVAYLANNPNAQYIQAGVGAYPNVGRNTLPGRRIDSIDMTLAKRVAFRERYQVEFLAQFFNLLNHPQFVPDSINNVFNNTYNVPSYRTMLLTGNPAFNNPEAVLGSNPRTIQLVLKLKF